LKDFSRRVRQLRRKVYRQMPVATHNRIAELDHQMSWADITAALARNNLGVRSSGAALVMWRACWEDGLHAWCYEFGFPQSLTHTVTIVEIDGVLEVHDPFFNLSYPGGLDKVLASLRDGNPVTAKRQVRDRKIYLADPTREPQQTVRWLEAHADRELKPVDGLRRFELLWNPEAFTATQPGMDTVSGDLAACGYPGDPQFMMLHPVAVFDGETYHRDRAGMPLVGGRNLQSPSAALRVALRDLEAERANAAEKTAMIARLQGELASANSRAETALREVSQRLSTEREAWLQQKVALQAGKSALEGELADTRARLSVANDLRAQKDSQIAQLRAEIEDTMQQLDLQQGALLGFESQRQESEVARLRLEGENRELKKQLDEGSRESEELRRQVASLEGQAGAMEQHAIEIVHYIDPLIEELAQLRRDHRSLTVERAAISNEKARLEAQIAASPSARLRRFWLRLGEKWQLAFRAGRPSKRRGPMSGTQPP
jgi:hypothetical protein